MSANEILASNLWPWPDPLMKRGRDGSIMFVNAAFLQLYGGRAQDWSGHVIDGWPAPAQQGAQRFETRAGEPGNEDVYDWVEMVMADGNAMAIARNVTALLTQTPPPADQMPADQMPVEAAPAQQAVASTPPPVETAIEQQPAQQTPMTQPVAEPAPALDTSAQSPAPQTPQPAEDGARAHEPQIQAAPQADAHADISAETHTEAQPAPQRPSLRPKYSLRSPPRPLRKRRA